MACGVEIHQEETISISLIGFLSAPITLPHGIRKLVSSANGEHTRSANRPVEHGSCRTWRPVQVNGYRVSAGQ